MASHDLTPGVLTGDAVQQTFALAKSKKFALPAANCIGTNSMNAVMETAAELIQSLAHCMCARWLLTMAPM